MEAVKILRADKPVFECCKFTYCNRSCDRRGHLLLPTKLQPPKENCPVCSKTPMELHIDCKTTTLEHFNTAVLKKHLCVNEPSIECGGRGMYEEGDDCDEGLRVNLPKTFETLQIGQGSTLSVEDFSQDLEFTFRVFHKDDFDEKETPDGFVVCATGGMAQMEAEKAERDAAEAAKAAAADGGAAAAAAVVEEEDEVAAAQPPAKRARK
jgi:hypothetical protein